MVLNRLCIGLLYCYKYIISPFLTPSCRFEPSCSTYALQAFQQKPFLCAIKLSAKRLQRCRPRGDFGFDPLVRDGLDPFERDDKNC